MPFPEVICRRLERFTADPPRFENAWYGPWTGILTFLFPPAEGYVVTPQSRLYGDDDSSVIPDFTIEVERVEDERLVLIVEIKNSSHWPNGIHRLLQQLNGQANHAFAENAREELYWIAVIGPHWKYGVKEDDGQDEGNHHGLIPLIEWHHTTHDDASFADFLELAALVRAI